MLQIQILTLLHLQDILVDYKLFHIQKNLRTGSNESVVSCVESKNKVEINAKIEKYF